MGPPLTPKQKEMLVLTVQAGWCTSTEPSIAATLWSVTVGAGSGIERDFHQGVGDALERFGLIEQVDIHLGGCVVIRSYLPSAEGLVRATSIAA